MDDLKLVADGFVKVVGSKDPNDKLSTGVGSASFIRPGEPILYTIRFENVKTASAPAQTVTIVDPLDANLDWSTFQPIEIAFNHVTLAVPPAAQDFTTTTRVATDLYPVVAMVRLDRRRGVVLWRMESLDEVTGDSRGSTGGFPATERRGPPRRGACDLQHSAQNRGFDVGYVHEPGHHRVLRRQRPILTPTVTNHLDAVPPESVAWFAGSLAGLVRIASAANDGMGSGIAGTELWCRVIRVRSNDGWNGRTERGMDRSVAGSVLRIFSVATDHAGNRERPPQEPDATLEFLTAVTIVSVHPLTLQWPGAMGAEYGVERSMDGHRWNTVAGPISVVGGRAGWTDGAPPAGSAFYRVRKW